jgi:glycosyltransferase involved in cell wall biosynthesis
MTQHSDAIVQIITKLELGGAQKVCLEIAQGLKTNNVPNYLISGNEGPLVDSVKHWDNIFLISELKREISWFAPLRELKVFIKLITILRTLHKKHPHLIVHTHSTKAGIVGRWAAWFAGVKKRIHTIHGFGFHDYQKTIPWVLNYGIELITSFVTTHYICVSSHDIATGIRLFPRFKQKHSLIRAAVNSEFFFTSAQKMYEESENVNGFIFGTIACFKPQKNLFDLLQAFNNVYQKNPHVKLEIVGDGILRSSIEQWINEHNLSKAVTLHGWQKNITPFLHRWNAFVLSSLWEGLPCAIIEARLFKLPIVSYDTGGIKDVIIHGENGFLYAQKNWIGLAQGMTMLATNPKIAYKLSMYSDNLSEFNADKMVKNHITLYKNLQGRS